MPGEIEVKSVLNKTKRRDPWFLDDYTFNPFSSCSFNCLYCYIRGSKYGSNLEENLTVKINAIKLLDQQLASRARKKQFGFIVLSSVTDPYLPVEKKYELTRRALEVILKNRFPVHVITKSDLVARDFDLLKEIDRSAELPEDLKSLERGVIISFSFSTLQKEVAKVFEPGAPSPTARLAALEQAKQSNFLSGVSFMPLLPFISDTSEQLNHAFSEFKRVNADYVLPATLTLFGTSPTDSKTLVLNAIKNHYPQLLEKYISYFSKSNEMPHFYRIAFKKKVAELHAAYGLGNRIF